MHLDFLQIILFQLFWLCEIQFFQNTNIFTDLFHCNTQQFFHIRTDIICLICFGIHHQKNIIYIHWQLLKQFVPIQDLRILFLKISPVLLYNKANEKGSNTEHNCTYKKNRAKLQTVHTGIDDILLNKSQKYPILNIWFFIDQIIILSIQIYQHRIGMSFFKLLRKRKDMFFRYIRMLSQNAKEIIRISPWLKRMIHYNTAIRMNHIALCISIKCRNIQNIHDISIFISYGNGIIFKSLIVSRSHRTGKNKQLSLPRNCRICYDILALLNLVCKIFLYSKAACFAGHHFIAAVICKKIEF